MRYALIVDGVVANIVEAEADYAAARGWVACPNGCEIGWLYDGQFAAPEPAPLVLLPITRRQAKHALLNAGLLTAAEQAIEVLPEPQRTAALIDWNDAAEFERDHPLISAIGAALNLSDEQIDEMFRDAAAL